MMTLTLAVAAWLVLTVWGWLAFRFSWLVALSSGLDVGIVSIAAVASGARGWPLFRLLLALYAGVNVVNIQIENVVFNTVPPTTILKTTASGLLAAIGASAALAWGRTRDLSLRSGNAHAIGGLAARLWWRLPLLGLTYIVLFMTAGALIWPYVGDFYTQSGIVTIPSFGVLLLTEFIRGVVHAVSLLPLLATMGGRRGQAAIVAGLALPILGGISALLLPIDDILPLAIRRVHIIEIFGSNFLFGIICTWLLVPRAAGTLNRGDTAHPSFRGATEVSP